MSYVKQLEEQNDELKQKLSVAEKKLETHKMEWHPFPEDSGCPGSWRLFAGKVVLLWIHPFYQQELNLNPTEYEVSINSSSIISTKVKGNLEEAKARAEEFLYE